MKTKRHPLLLYQLLSRRLRVKLLLLLTLLLLAGIADLIWPILGPYWYCAWVGLLVSLLLWLYYALLVRRAAIVVRPDVLLVQGPLSSLKISYGRLNTTTSVRLDRHFPIGELSAWQRGAFRPLYEQTCLLIELQALPRAAARQRYWLSPLLFSKASPAIVAAVPDWMSLSQDIEAARSNWRLRRADQRKGDMRSPAARVLSFED